MQGPRLRRGRDRLLGVTRRRRLHRRRDEHALREISLGDEAAYRIADFPLTAEVLRTGESRAVSFLDGDVDPAEAFILRDLGMSALLMVPIVIAGRAWGLVELYEMRHRRFLEDDVAVAEFVVAQAAKRLEDVGAGDESERNTPPVYDSRPSGRADRARGRRSAWRSAGSGERPMRATTNAAPSTSKAAPVESSAEVSTSL